MRLLARTAAIGLFLGTAIGTAPTLLTAQEEQTPQQEAPPPSLTPEQQRQLDELLDEAMERQRNAQPTVEDAKERLRLWEMILLLDDDHPQATLFYSETLSDLQDARAAEEQAQQSERSVKEDQRAKLRMAERMIHEQKNLQGAENILLSLPEDDPYARGLRNTIRAKRDSQRVMRRVRNAAVALGALGVGLGGIMAWKKKAKGKLPGGKKGGGDAGDKKAAARAGGGGGALIKVVDGVARGKLVNVSDSVFRIGAADFGEDDPNDLIISDNMRLVSRRHCTIIQKGRKFFLLDSSLQGTKLNGKPLERGEEYVLKDGDEFTVADVSRMKFLRT